MTTPKKENLSVDDINVLQKIFEFGGYTTAPSLNTYITDRDISTVRRLLYKFTDSGYLKATPFLL